MVATCASLASAQAGDGAIRLVLHPRAGDTLHTRMEQQTEMSSMPTAAGIAPSAGTMRTMSTTVSIEARTIVQVSYPATTVVLTIVDAAHVTSSDPHASALIADTERALQGQQLLLHLASDGSVARAEDARGGKVSRDAAAAMSAMPAVFPRDPVRIGDKWTREMPLPSGGPLGSRGRAHVRSVFRLDSLSRSGIAYISMRGEILPDDDGEVQPLTGTITGAMQVDRARGWMTDSRVVIVLRSLFVPMGASGSAPMRIVTRVTQRLRTMDKR